MHDPFNLPARKRRPAINITSLIDVMFLLLIFFMVSSTFTGEPGIDITLPSARNAQQHDTAGGEIGVAKNGQFYFGAKAVTEAELRTLIEEFLREEPQASLVLRADREAHFGRVVRAMDIARNLGGSRLVIPTELLPDSPPPQEAMPREP